MLNRPVIFIDAVTEVKDCLLIILFTGRANLKSQSWMVRHEFAVKYLLADHLKKQVLSSA
jgi:hypothetical protein